MASLQKYRIKLTTYSPLILSPREQNVITTTKEGKIQYLYPFYQYGEYDSTENPQYYIPGSSIKGAIGKSNIGSQRLLVDDIRLNSDFIEKRSLTKIQKIDIKNKGNKTIKDEVFFPMLKVEMLRSNVEVEGEMFCNGSLNETLERMDQESRNRIETWDQYQLKIISELFDQKDKRTQFEALIESPVKKLKALEEKIGKPAHLLFLGGFKGKILAGVKQLEAKNELIPVSFYIDKETSLPYGIVNIEIIEGEYK